MSKQDFDIQAKVSVNLDPASKGHSWRELTEMGLVLDGASQRIRSAANSMAGHYYELALAIERSARKQRGTTFAASGKTGTAEFTSKHEDDQETIRIAKAAFSAHVDNELAWLKSHKGWERDRLPLACDAAVRKIVGAWDNKFSLEVLPTVSKIAKANSDKTKESNEAIANAYNLGPKTEQEPASLELKCDPKHHAAIMQAVAALDDAFQADENQAGTQAQSVVVKCGRIVAHAAAQLAGKVA